ncbi:unnamed protein product [Citrullus colocynthis]|uniref:Uncharacterized protein n=1 Tax=Citrullus colocynthis TaxID=252529 RepID=A0ABP0YNG8_9ROSI
MPPWKKMERMWGLASDGGGDDTGDFKIISALLRGEFGGRIQCIGGDGSERWRGWVWSSGVCDGSEPVFPVGAEGEDKGKIVGYKSGCLTVKSDKYCCRGEYAEPRNSATSSRVFNPDVHQLSGINSTNDVSANLLLDQSLNDVDVREFMNENYGKFMDVGGVESVTNETGNYNDVLRELVVIKQHVARLDGFGRNLLSHQMGQVEEKTNINMRVF